VDTEVFILEVERNKVIWGTLCVEYRDRMLGTVYPEYIYI
jgi:hypothetical protein